MYSNSIYPLDKGIEYRADQIRGIEVFSRADPKELFTKVQKGPRLQSQCKITGHVRFPIVNIRNIRS